MTLKELYDYIIENYGNRGCWISDLASNLAISEDSTNHLTYVLGYRRGRLQTLATYATFASNAGVCAIQKRL